MRFLLVLSLFVLMQAALFAGRAEADYENIAVIEDTFGNILPNMGLCSNMAYSNGLCVTAAGPAFYAQYGDNYDVLVFFSAKEIPAMYNPKQGIPLQADVKGIGQDTVPWNYSAVGSAGRLLQVLAMGSISSMPATPEDLYPSPPFKGIEVLAHEIGHHWMAYANVNLDDGAGNMDILRGHFDETTTTHWSCWFNNPSVMYGGILTDNGEDSFTDVNGPRRFTQLDQYLMGLRLAEEVDPMWYVRVGYDIHGCADYPLQPGVPKNFDGQRVDFDIDDIIRANGQRIPASSPCHLKVAFAVIHAVGAPPSEEQMVKVESYRTAIEEWWPWATDERGSLDTRLDGCGAGTPECPGQPSPQCDTPIDGDWNDGDETDGDAENSPDGDLEAPESDGDEMADGDAEAIVIPDGDETQSDGDTAQIDGDIPQDSFDGDASEPEGGSSGSCSGGGAASARLLLLLLLCAAILRRRTNTL